MPFRGGEDEDYTQYDKLREPFAHTNRYNPIDLIGDDDDVERYQEALYALPGALYVCDHGCGEGVLLIVSGPARGQIWDDQSANAQGVYPATSADGTVHTFASWYLAWLDDAQAKLRA